MLLSTGQFYSGAAIPPAIAPFGAFVVGTHINVNATSEYLIDYDTSEVFDNEGFHSLVSNPSRLTVPVAHNGKYALVIVHAPVTGFSGEREQVNLNHYDSSDVLQKQYTHKTDKGGGTAVFSAVVMGPVLLSTGDYFTSTARVNSDTDANYSGLLSILILDDYIDGAVLVKKASDLTAQNLSVAAALTFDTEVFDTDGFHDTGSNPERLTIPSGVDYVMAIGQINISLGTADDILRAFILHKDSVGVIKNTTEVLAGSAETTQGVNICALLAVVPGDYLELQVILTGDTSVTIDASRTHFGLSSIPSSGLIAAQAKKSADATVNMADIEFTNTFNTDVFDTDSIHDTGSNTERLTVPAGVRYAVVNGCMGISSTTSGRFLRTWIRHFDSGGVVKRDFRHSSSGNTTLRGTTVTGFTAVEEGDYFTYVSSVSIDGSVTIRADRTRFSMWCIP